MTGPAVLETDVLITGGGPCGLVLANELVAARTQPRVVYRYLPRDLDTYLREEPRASVTFQSMFENDDIPVWRY